LPSATKRLAILLIGELDSDTFESRLLEGAAREPELVHVRTAAEGRSLAAEARFDLVVVDTRVGDQDGLELVRQLRGAGVETPLLMLTEQGGEEVAVETLRAGATDYLVKAGLSAESLRRSVRYALDVSHQAGLRRRAEESLRLREDQLREAQHLETVATLSGGVAHEFNNLLNVVVGYADMIRRRLPPGDALHRHVEHILQAAEKATVLTRQLLAFSRSQVLQPVVLEAGQLVNDLAPVVRSVLGRRVEVQLRIDPGVGCIKADRSQVDHALMNLVVNAKDAMPDGGQLVLETKNVDLDDETALPRDSAVRRGRYVLLGVADSGSGMAADVQSRAFEPFFTTKGRANATGLGLSTVVGIVRQSGGHVSLESEPGKGTSVRIYLPLVDAGGKAVALEPQKLARGDETILVVDDEKAMREVLVQALRAAGYSVTEAASGTEALQAAAAKDATIDLVLTDVMMPGMSGPELATRLRQARPGLRVVYMSGATREALRQRDDAIDAPFLWKPFSTEELTQTIRQALDGAR
jgi:signal transduction histidine kinase